MALNRIKFATLGTRFYLIIIFCVVALGLMAVNKTALDWVGDFESGDFSGWELENPGKLHNFNMETNIVRSGNYSSRVELRYDDPKVSNSYRAELKITDVGGHPRSQPEGTENWYGFSVYIPSNFAFDFSEPELIVQWHADPDKDQGEPYRSPPLAFAIHGDTLQVKGGWEDQEVNLKGGHSNPFYIRNISIDSMMGVWTDFVVHVKWDFRKNVDGGIGFIELYKNQQLIATRFGPNCFNDKSPLASFKWGIYKWPWKDRPGSSNVETRVFYFDEYRQGDENSSLAEVSPTN